ncbi:MAG: arginine decarboxylase, partial [Bacteroidetes bacterium]|nr:arginine decarboxylase [Bacteroidota bacterium]
MQSYQEFLDLSVGFPQEGFEIIDDELYFNDLNLMEMIETYGTPLRFTYLPMVSKKIQQAKLLFQQAIVKNNYRGSYKYCYCTKSSHFKHIVEEALKNDIHLETSSAFDMPMIDALEKKGVLNKDMTVICNGFKTYQYKTYIVDMLHDGFKNIIPVLDNKEEFNIYDDEVELDSPCNLGIRIAAEEQPNSQFYTSRLGIRMEDVIEFYTSKIEPNPNFKVKLLHFFINSGISDTPYYWNELEKYVTLYCK